MRKSSRSISLALIGSALVAGGCGVADDEAEWSEGGEVAQNEEGIDPTAQGVATGAGQYGHGGSGGYGAGRTASRVAGAMIGSQIGRSMGGGMGSGGGGMAPGASARGGFGSSAGHGSGSSAS